MTAAPVPVLVKEKRWLTGPSTSRSVPKSHSYSSKTSAEMLFCAHPAAQTNSAAVSSTALFAIPYTFITIKPCKSIKYSCNEERRIHNNRYIGVPARQKQFGETLSVPAHRHLPYGSSPQETNGHPRNCHAVFRKNFAQKNICYIFASRNGNPPVEDLRETSVSKTKYSSIAQLVRAPDC